MKKLLILMSILALSIPAYAASFPDVDESDTYYEAVEFLFTENIISGNDDGTYAPDRVLNRAELMKVIAEGASTYFGWAEGTFDLYINSTCFDDVPAGEWYTKYICYGKEMGWVVGYEDGTLFKPSQDVTFAEGLKITYMGFGLDYSEEGEVWYQDVVEDASMYNYIPYTITAFDAGLARDAMADLVTRIIKYDTDELETYLGDRADIVVTYDTIEAGEDLSELVEEEVAVEEEEEEETEVEDEEPYTYMMSIDDMEFVDGSIIVLEGATVTWVNNDNMAHTVDLDGLESSGTIAAGDSFSQTFTETGTYDYLCALHPSMTGTVTVLDKDSEMDMDTLFEYSGDVFNHVDLSDTEEAAHDANRIADLSSIQSALFLKLIDSGEVPDQADDYCLDTAIYDSYGSAFVEDNFPFGLPEDPSPSTDSNIDSLCTDGNYTYLSNPGDGTYSFALIAVRSIYSEDNSYDCASAINGELVKVDNYSPGCYVSFTQ